MGSDTSSDVLHLSSPMQLGIRYRSSSSQSPCLCELLRVDPTRDRVLFCTYVEVAGDLNDELDPFTTGIPIPLLASRLSIAVSPSAAYVMFDAMSLPLSIIDRGLKLIVPSKDGR